MSTTPAFSPGPCSTSFPRVGNRFRCALLDLYEQCSLHITLKMPSSVMLGSRPSIFLTRAYSSDVNPCSAAISGVTLISVNAVAISLVRRELSATRILVGAEQSRAPFQHDRNPSMVFAVVVRATRNTNSCRSLGRAHQHLNHRPKNGQPIGRIQRRFDGSLRMRHQPGNIPLAVANPRDVRHRAIRISGGVI